MLADGLRLAASALAAADIVGALEVALVAVVTGFGALGRDEVGVSAWTGAVVVAIGARRVRVTELRVTQLRVTFVRATEVRATPVEATAWPRGLAATGVEASRDTEARRARRGVGEAARCVEVRGVDRLVSVGLVTSAVDAPALSVACEPVAPDASVTA